MRWLSLSLLLCVSCMHHTSSGLPDSDGRTDGADSGSDRRDQDLAVDRPATDASAIDPSGDAASDTIANQDLTIGNVVTVGPNGTYSTIEEALKNATPHSTILVADGVYEESLTVSKGGSSESERLLILAEHSGAAVIRNAGRVLTVDAPWVTVQGFVLDGDWGDSDVVSVKESADHLVLRDLEIKNSEKDGIDISGGHDGGCVDVLIDGCTIHHMLAGDASNPVDAHCIVAEDFHNLTIRNTEAYYCSGDCLQVGTDRDPWDGLVVEDCHFWTGPLPGDAAGFKQGEVPGENAVDTKADPHPAPWSGTITLRDSVFSGFDPASGAISNRAALNLKDQVTGLIERCVLYGNEIGFRVRGDADGSNSTGGVDGLLVKNTLLYRNQYHVRVEDDAKNVVWHHNTFGQLIDDKNIPVPLDQGAYGSDIYKGGGGGNEGPGWETNNNLYLGILPDRVTGSGDFATDDTSNFVNFAQDDYHLVKDLDAPNAVGVAIDLDKKPRSAATPDVGAYEFY